MDGQEKAANSRRCGIKRVGFLEHKRRRIEWAGRLLLSCFSRRCCGAGSSTTAAAVAAAVGGGRREHKEPIRYSHTGAISACGPPSVRGPRGEEWRSSRVSRTNHPRAGATASSDPRRDPVAGVRRRERPAAVTAARERWLARSPTTGGGRCFIYRPPLGLREPSDGPRAAGSERTMAS